MIRKCKHCEKEIQFENGKQFGGHVTNCKDNPDKIERDLNSIKKKNYELTCKCGEDYTVNVTEKAFNKGKYKKFCCRKCANSRIFSEETRLKMSKAQTGKKLTEEAKKRLSEVNKGHKHNSGRILSEEHKNKIRAKAIGRIRTEEHKKNLSIALTGIPKKPEYSAERRQQISETSRKSWEQKKLKNAGIHR